MNLRQLQTAIRVFREQGLRGISQVLLLKVSHADSKTSIPKVWTEYMSWLRFANAGMLIKGNVYCFDYAIKNLPSNSPIIEIGSFCGLSTNMITHCKEKNNVKNTLITCDKWKFEGEKKDGSVGDSTTITHAEYGAYVKETYIRNISMFSRNDLPYTIEMFSNEFFTAWGNSLKCQDVLEREIELGGPVSFCYIDGNHTYEYAKQDFENCDKYLEPGGFVLFDDSHDGSGFGVCKVVKEVLASGRYDLIDKNPNYFFRKKT